MKKNLTVPLFAVLVGGAAWAQSPAAARTPSPNTNGPVSSGCAGCNSNGNSGGVQIPQTIFLSGKVILTDGSAPPEPVKIERVCNGSRRLEGYTDRKGRFNFDLGRSSEIQDASDTSGPGLGSSRDLQGAGSRSSGVDRRFFGCEIRAVLPGYRSDAVSLTNIRYLDNPDVGSIVLHRMGNGEGLTISATSALAPKDAQKAYSKALDAASKGKREEAKVNLEKAVALYPRYAAAWFELGKWNEQSVDFDTARKNYGQAVEADSKYLPPYERLSMLALKDKDWQHLSDYSAKLLSLDPLNYPDAYYMNGVAGFQLQQYDAAEKSLREAVRLDPENKNPRTQYVLGLVLAQKHSYAAAAESIRAFLALSPSDSDADFIRKQLAQIEEAAGKP